MTITTAESIMTRIGVFERQAVLFTIVTDEISESLNVHNTQTRTEARTHARTHTHTHTHTTLLK